mmetsp:Transcript_40315/g.46254  ORF Transcript_40315/g.46254 Transcript_40315/m.46254 type:complete len:83 (-) Transcript_40315:691-939(-)
MDELTFAYDTFFIISRAVVVYIIAWQIVKRLLLYAENHMLYLPSYPSEEYQYPEENPEGLRSPAEYNIPFEDIAIPQESKYC